MGDLPAAMVALIAGHVALFRKHGLTANREEAAIRAESSGRRAFVSPKQYLSTHDSADLDQPLSDQIDPTKKFTALHPIFTRMAIMS